MKVICPNCRAQFTAADYDFMASVLGSREKEIDRDRPDDSQWIFKLFRDADSKDKMLDDGALLKSVLNMRGCLQVSLHFYFYILVRHVFLRSGVEDRDLADYVAELLAEFAQSQRMRQSDPTGSGPMEYLFEMLAAMAKADDENRFLIQAHVGNYALFLAGVFPEHVLKRVSRRGAPGFRYYEELGSSHYRVASDHRLARKFALSPIYLSLANAFHPMRMALNDLAGDLIFLRQDKAVETLLREVENPGGAGEDWSPKA